MPPTSLAARLGQPSPDDPYRFRMRSEAIVTVSDDSSSTLGKRKRIESREIVREMIAPETLLQFESHPCYHILEAITFFLCELCESKGLSETDWTIVYEEHYSFFLCAFSNFTANLTLDDFKPLDELNVKYGREVIALNSYLKVGGSLGLKPSLAITLIKPASDPMQHLAWHPLMDPERLEKNTVYAEVKKAFKCNLIKEELSPRIHQVLKPIVDEDDASAVATLVYLWTKLFPIHMGNLDMDCQDASVYTLTLSDMSARVTWNSMTLMLGLNKFFLWEPFTADRIELSTTRGGLCLKVAVYRLCATRVTTTRLHGQRATAKRRRT